MKKLSMVVAAAFCVASFASLAVAADEKPAADAKKPAAEAKKPAEAKKATEGKKPSVKKERVTMVSATVEAIDQKTRKVTLKTAEGKSVDFVAGDQVKNLAQVKVGDIVDITYYESIAVKVFKPGEIQQGASVDVAQERQAKPGEKPKGAIGSQVTITATVDAINSEKAIVTLRLADGKVKFVKVQDRKNMENVKVGDEVVIILTEALAVSVKPAKPAKK